MRQIFLGTVIIALVMITMSQAVNAQDTTSCPEGGEVIGAAPPRGVKAWCQKINKDGKIQKNGFYLEWYRDGKPKVQGQYKDDRKVGVWVSLDTSGGPKLIEHWEDGLREGESVEYFKQGGIKTEGAFHDGKKDGKWITQYENGQIQSEGVYNKGRPTGLWTNWSKLGVKEKVEDRTPRPRETKKESAHKTSKSGTGKPNSRGGTQGKQPENPKTNGNNGVSVF